MSLEKKRHKSKEELLYSIGLPGLKGFLNIWILSLLSKRQMNGYEMLKEISGITAHHWEPKTGSLYPALHKLQKKGLIKAGRTGARHQIVYTLTPEGRGLIILLREKLADIHGKHKFRHMFELLVWPDESDELKSSVDELVSSLHSLRNTGLSEKEKIRRIRSAASSLK